ncbi:MAG: hypothetical protein HFG96_03875 [Lachnospiraceae bacterium]|nr:hypothetical protein [uncultured Blautia sp.]MCI8317651.1 hypothetical protein [Lachnospiraceae bacterium]
MKKKENPEKEAETKIKFAFPETDSFGLLIFNKDVSDELLQNVFDHGMGYLSVQQEKTEDSIPDILKLLKQESGRIQRIVLIGEESEKEELLRIASEMEDPFDKDVLLIGEEGNICLYLDGYAQFDTVEKAVGEILNSYK